MSSQRSWDSGLSVIYLASCALHGILPDKATVDAMDAEPVYIQAKRHKMQSVTYMALSSVEDNPAEKYPLWYRDHTQSMRMLFSYALEREKVQQFFEKNGIWYLPLKGIVLQNLYPKFGMRQMVDNDYLVDAEKCELIRDRMVADGYDVYVYGRASHDVYHKLPYGNFEMHKTLCTESLSDRFARYYSNVKERLIKDDTGEYGYHFTDEDRYIYFIVHAYRHYAITGGTGVRTLMDAFIYDTKCGKTMDRAYIDRELKHLEILDFEISLRKLAIKIFDRENCRPDYCNTDLTEEEKGLLDYFVGSGCFGMASQTFKQTLEGYADEDGKVNAKSKFKYYLNRLFPTGLYIKENYPTLYKHKYLIPFFWIYRIVTKIFTRTKYILKEINVIRKQ